MNVHKGDQKRAIENTIGD